MRRNFMLSAKGASAMEYAVLAGLVAMVSFFMIAGLGSDVEDIFRTASENLKNRIAPVLTGVTASE
jgi:Flp pilus assembly pilin Flp